MRTHIAYWRLRPQGTTGKRYTVSQKESLAAHADYERVLPKGFLWIMDHRCYLSEAYGSDVGAEAATQDFTGRFGRRGLKQRLASTLQTWRATVRSRFGSTDSLHNVEGAENDRAS